MSRIRIGPYTNRPIVPTMPIWYVLVGNTRSDVKHDDSALAIDVITISQPPEFLLACCVPDIELDASVVLGYPVISKSMPGSVRLV